MIFLLSILLSIAQLVCSTARNRTTNELLNANRYRFPRRGNLRSYDCGLIRNVEEGCFGLGGEAVNDNDAKAKTKLFDKQLSSVSV
ncbi:unnamed protein product [Peronospora farinosa]|uniref:Secreted protein n=1 Tax=Peronospora farinosa TaxID=134698 RepID=A0AAV0TVX6_9STRA|nr:unnamed protein product [Peronospora farinosa]